MKLINTYEKCQLCPRDCKAKRNENKSGNCGATSRLKVARAALHYWEEPCISGKNGSGAVFFSGCPLHCIFCQNKSISNGEAGREITIERLVEIFFELEEKGANNINLVTPSHYAPSIVCAIEKAKNQGFNLPIVYNTGGYDKADTIKMFEGLVDVYLPDFKYMDRQLAKKFSFAEDYPDIAKKAIAEMVRQQPETIFDEDKIIQKGVIVRQLLLPGHVKDAKEILRYLHNTYGSKIYISMMSQYTPLSRIEKYDELNRKVTKREYDRYIQYALDIGIENGFMQEGDVAESSFIPQFDGSGV